MKKYCAALLVFLTFTGPAFSADRLLTYHVGDGSLNVCAVSDPEHLDGVKSWAEGEIGSNLDGRWHSIAPLARDAAGPSLPGGSGRRV